MPVYKYTNIVVDVICILICAILLVQIHIMHTKRKTDGWFACSLCANIFMILGDMFHWILEELPGQGIRIALFASTTVYFVSSGILMYAFFLYIYTYMGKKKSLPRWPVGIDTALMVIQIVMALSSPLLGTIFTYTLDNIYQRGFLFMASQTVAAGGYALTLGMAAISWRQMTRKEKAYFVAYFCTLAASEIIQVFNYGLPLLNIAFTLDCLLVSLFINTGIDEMLSKVRKERETERIARLEDRQKTWAEISRQTINALSSAVEAKDRYTNGHSLRVAEYAREIVRRMGWDEEGQRHIYYAGLVHDVGKIRVPDAIINKKGKLDQEEFEQIKLHPVAGYYILKEVSSIADFALGARWHHERYDGRGYPNGLAGEEIPLVARVIGVADAYDAMTSNRSYRDTLPQEVVRGEIEKGMGTQFDPAVAKIMLGMIDEDTEYRLRQPRMDGQTILIIDREEETAGELETLLNDFPGIRLVTADSKDEGIELLQKERPSAAIVDVDWLNGALEWILVNQPGLPLIAVTRDKTALQRMEALAISDCLTKPFAGRLLHESVSNVLLHTRKEIT